MQKPVDYIVLFFVFFCLNSFSQEIDSDLDSIKSAKNTSELQQEQKELEFQKFFFDALQQKAIGNFDKAITALESCQNIKPDNVAVSFELSKNYLEQKQYVEATEYLNKTLKKMPNNIILLSHLKEIYLQEQNYDDAIKIHKKLMDKKPHQYKELLNLYIRANKIEEARNLLVELEKKGQLSDENLQSLAKVVNGDKTPKPVTTASNKQPKEHAYYTDKTFLNFKEMITYKFERNLFQEIADECKEAVELFPAQPLVYLSYGKALNKLKKYTESIPILKSGLDFVFDGNELEADFYDELALAYKGSKNNVEASKYYKKAAEKRKN